MFIFNYQKEIELIVDKLGKFKPTKIVIERGPEKQQKQDSLYIFYINGVHTLPTSEEQQIGFIIPKRMGLKNHIVLMPGVQIMKMPTRTKLCHVVVV